MGNTTPVVVKVDHNTKERFEFKIGAAGLPEIVIDQSGHQKEALANDHYGARLLCAAAMACFTNTFYNSLVQHGAEVRGMSASAEIEKEKDMVSRTKFTAIHMDVVVDLDDQYREVFEAAKESMERGSLVTYSLEDAIEMDITMEMKNG